MERPQAQTGGARQGGTATGKLTGTVLDDRGDPVIGAAVLVKESGQGTVTDLDGNFTIDKVRGGKHTLRISYVGYTTMEASAAVGTAGKYTLKEESSMMNELVVTGYQELAKEKVTGSISTVPAAKISERYTSNILSNLEGRVAGLTTYNGKTTIRGTSSLYAETNPLLVVDGIPIEGKIDDLNPYDIESVNVLKDAAAAAIYGARASNGIIVITTKNAKDKNKINIDFTSDITMYDKRNMDYNANYYMNAEQQVKVDSEYYDYYFLNNEGEIKDPMGSFETYLNKGQGYVSPVQYGYYKYAKGEITRQQLDNELNRLKKNNYAKEYADRIYNRRVMQQYNLSLRSRSDKSTSNLTLNYKYDNSGQIETYDQLININYKGSYEVAKWLTATFSVNSIIGKNKEPGKDASTGYGHAGWSTPWDYPSYESFTNADGSQRLAYYGTSGYFNGNNYWGWTPEEGLYDLGVDPVNEFKTNSVTTKRNHTRYHGDLLFRIIDGLTLNTQLVYEQSHTTATWLASEGSHVARVIHDAYAVPDGDGFKHLVPEGGMMQTKNTSGDYWTARAQANYNKTFGKHVVAALAGIEFRETKSKGTKALMLGFNDQLQSSGTELVDMYTLSQMRNSPYFRNGQFYAKNYAYSPYIDDQMGLIAEEHHRYASGYMNLTYTYDDKYNVFGSFRKDYADVYGLNSKFRGKPLWAIGAGWNMHNEEFIKGIKWINFLKLRLSYGVTGNIYQGATSYMTASSGYTNDLTGLPVSYIESPANPELRWEKNQSTNVGIDFSLFDNRLRGNLDYYKKVGKDIFSNRNLDITTGYSSMFVNTACMENNGIEIQLTSDNIRPMRRKDFGWSTTFTMSHNKNKITKVENASTKASQLFSSPYRKGYPSSALWNYRFAKINDTAPNLGQLRFHASATDETKVSHDPWSMPIDILEYSGQTDPKIVMGMDNRLTWNGFSFNALMTYYGGHVMRAVNPNEMSRGVNNGGLIPSYFINAWTPEHPTDIPGIGRYGSPSTTGTTAYNSKGIRKADFLKIRNLVFGYELPQEWLRAVHVNRVALRLQIDNPKYLWIRNKVHVDPETLGIRNLTSYVFGINVNL